MNGKFSTTSSSLFNNINPESLPKWMEGLNIDIKDVENIDLGITPKTAFSEKQTVYREERNGDLRSLEASFNDTKLITDAKIQLAKFLSGKYYKVEAKTNNNTVNLDVKIDGLPARFSFNFAANSGRLNANNTFNIEINGSNCEYPFSKAGLEECIADIKNNKIETSTKVDGIDKIYHINREEIIRRYNGKLREATDKINELISNGDLVGIGSNTYASFYDTNYLFPQLQKEAGEDPLPAFEFAPNTEHVAANPYSSAKMLSIEASKMLAELFPDFIISNSQRDNNELLVKAKVLNNNGVSKIADFCFGIEKDRLASLKFVEINDDRMTVEQLLNKMNLDNKVVQAYLNNTTATKKIYRGVVLTEREIKNKLCKIIRAEVIPHVIENWVSRDLINPINSTTFTTEHSFENLLANINTKVLTADEKEEIMNYSKKVLSNSDRIKAEDTGIRDYDNVEASNELRLVNLNNYLTKYFKNFEVSNIQNDNYSTNHLADLNFIDRTSGLRHNVCLVIDFDVNKIRTVNAVLHESACPISELSNKFANSTVLSAYLQDNKANVLGGKITISHENLKRRLSGFLSLDDAGMVIDNWYKKGLIKEISAGTFVSNYSLEQLLQDTMANVLSDNDRKEIAIAKQYFGQQNRFQREAVEDSGVREPEEYVTNDTMLSKANEFLAKHFSSFKPEGIKTSDETLCYTVKLFDETTGLSSSVAFAFNFDGNKITGCNANLNGQKVGIDNIKKAFAMNDILSKYLQVNAGKRIDAPMVITTSQLRNKLASITNADLNEIEEVITKWENTGKVNKIASNVIASKHTLEQLLSMSSIKPLNDDEIKERISKAQRDRSLKLVSSYVQDSDTRKAIDSWSPERMLLHAKMELNKFAKDYDILDFEINENEFLVTARVVNPNQGIRQKVKVSFNNENGKLGNISGNPIKNLDDKALNTFIQHNAVNQRNYKNLISKTQLKAKLASVLDTDNIDSITESLVNYEILKPINNSTFASDYSVAEIVNHLSKFGNTDLEAANDNMLIAKRDENSIKIADMRVKDSDTRTLNIEKELLPQFINLKEKLKNTAEKAYKQKIITSNKFDKINCSLKEASNNKDLENIWKELKKYFN